MNAWTLPLLVAALSALLTGLVRRYAMARGVLDVPNARSSHTMPTPRGGGIAIVAAALAGFFGLAVVGGWAPAALWALAGAGGLVALVGFLDDHGHVAPGWRLAAHFAAAAWVLGWLGALPSMTIAGATFEPGWPGLLVAALCLVWLLNLYNFMDGIDGIAGVEAVAVGVGGALLHAAAGEHALATAPLVLAGAAAGFLLWNFPPAKIFMGDSGSGFLGIAVGVLWLHSAGQAPQLLWSWAILLGVFVVDASATLLRRLLRGERILEAHRSHAYQRASRRLGGHRPVTLAVAAIDIGWLLPIALWVGAGGIDGAAGLAIAYLPLVALAIALGAGKPDRE